MKKSLLTAAVIAAASGFALANKDTPMGVNSDGIGQVLIYPYYNVNDGFDTGFTVVNTSDTYRAVKVRIIEGLNSWEVLDFNLYLSPWDVWGGALHKTEKGIRLLTSDNSCTLPEVMGDENVFLRDFNLSEIEKAKPETFLSRMSEGYIEVIDMGAVVDDKAQEAIKHKDGKPNCNDLKKFYDDNWEKNPDKGIRADGVNALTGSAYLVNVKEGLSGGYNPVAIENFTVDQKEDQKNTLHNIPGSSFPNLNGQVERGDTVVYAGSVNNYARVKVGNGSKVIDASKALKEGTETYGQVKGVTPAAVSLSAVLATQDIVGEYFVHQATKSASAWVITMPTKHFFTNPDTSNKITRGLGQFGFLKSVKKDETDTAKAPFTSTFANLDEPVTVSVWDGEEQGYSLGKLDFSPSPRGAGTSLPAETSVLNWQPKGVEAKLFSTINGFQTSSTYNSGWARLTFNDPKHVLKASDGSFVIRGLPAVGISATKYVNGTLGGNVLSNYLYIQNLNYERNNDVK